MNIATWNINSIKVRLPQVVDWLIKNQIDVLCLQETKTIDDNFPYDVFKQLGYQSYFYGQKSYNGVAIITRYSAYNISYGINNYEDEQRRVISITVRINNIDIRVICLYCPNGQSLESDKYKYKVVWFEELKKFVISELKKYTNLILLGDYNIAPTDEDVYDSDIWKDTILVSEKERKLFNDLINLGLNDTFRTFPQDKESFTWWDYRNYSFIKNNGLRIDHILSSNTIKNYCKSCKIDKIPRSNKQPSDHAPVILNLDII